MSNLSFFQFQEEKETMDSESSDSNDEQSEDSALNDDDDTDYATAPGSGDNGGGVSSGYNSASNEFSTSPNEHHAEIVKTIQSAQTQSKNKKKKKNDLPQGLDPMPVDTHPLQRIEPENPENENCRKENKTSDSTPETTNVEQKIESTTVTENELSNSETSNVHPRLNDNADISSLKLELDAGHVSQVTGASHNVISDNLGASTSSNHTIRTSENQRDASLHASNLPRLSLRNSASESAANTKPKVTYDSWAQLFRSPSNRGDQQQHRQSDDALRATSSSQPNQQELHRNRTVIQSRPNIGQQNNAIPHNRRDWKPWDPLEYPIFTEERKSFSFFPILKLSIRMLIHSSIVYTIELYA
ncbi:hypothetical protein PIB30_022061 [Stylosanthes scabra]|uniref:Uncharacterized protein n=1 Tax=Stylosanthes scabra TaxID=79078 RepID=A0ABU6Z5N9_9FABA|nr:hypothetical protein [Stylosanthes scabra]